MDTLRKSAAPTTAETLSHLPEDGYRYELVRGELVRDSPAGSRHGAIAHHMGRLLGIWAQQEGSSVEFVGGRWQG